jgi:hypothetical protein
MRIKNKSWSPLVVSLPDGKSRTLAARGIDEVSAEDFQSPEFQRLAKSRTVIVLPEEEKKPADTGKEPEEKKKPAGTADEPSEPAASPPHASLPAAGPTERGGGSGPQ